MSSETSTETAPGAVAPATSLAAGDPGLRPWQFFLLAGMLGATASVIVATGQSPASIIFISVTIVAAGFVGLAVYRTLSPLVSPEQSETPTMLAGRTRAGLEREKTLALRSIKELEFDYAMKKVAQADYEEMIARLRARALRLMQQLDAGTGYRDDIERELQTRLAGNQLAGLRSRATESDATPASPATEDLQEERDFSTAVALAEVVSPACACGTTNDRDAKFCKNCGSKLHGSA